MAIGALVQGCVGIAGLITCGCLVAWYSAEGEDAPPWLSNTAKFLGIFTALSLIAMGWFLALRY